VPPPSEEEEAEKADKVVEAPVLLVGEYQPPDLSEDEALWQVI
jgi:hypothetical protein